jgi:hypothetical protein
MLGETIHSYRILCGEPLRKGSSGRHSQRQEDDTKIAMNVRT